MVPADIFCLFLPLSSLSLSLLAYNLFKIAVAMLRAVVPSTVKTRSGAHDLQI
jgi:hypothetical protein